MPSPPPGRLAALYRHPIKGFTPEPLDSARLEPGRCFPCDRLYAVEDGPSGFDPQAPRHLPKMRFAVLARLPEVAKVRTRYDGDSGELHVDAPGHAAFRAVLTNHTGRAAFADWLQGFLGERAHGALKVLEGPGDHRFMDSRSGFVSLVNMASIRDLEVKVGRPLDRLRFRANLYVEGWPPWAENGWVGRTLQLGTARASVFKPIVRCIATHVDPATGERDMDIVKALFDNFGHMHCGLYVHVTQAGRIAPGDACGPVEAGDPA